MLFINFDGMHLPKMVFTEWYTWKDRSKVAGSENPGVYILAKFKKVPSGNANPLDMKIIYVGETCSSLKKRWDQFDRSAFRSGIGHSGAYTYRDKFKGDTGQDLFVAALPVSNKLMPAELRSSFIRFIERKLILDFVKNWKSLPKCNRK